MIAAASAVRHWLIRKLASADEVSLRTGELWLLVCSSGDGYESA